jgi:hypothetical protein
MCEGHELCIQNLIRKREGKNYFGDISMGWNMILKLILKNLACLWTVLI